MRKILVGSLLLVLISSIVATTLVTTAAGENPTEVIRSKENQFYFKIHGKPYTEQTGQPYLGLVEYTFKNLSPDEPKTIQVILKTAPNAYPFHQPIIPDVTDVPQTRQATTSASDIYVWFTLKIDGVVIPEAEGIIWIPPNNP
jgi:hypothetical protein